MPTRELAIQVAEAFETVRALPQGLPRAADLRRPELRGAVEAPRARRPRRRRHAGPRDGPPARGSLNLAGLARLVLDEADEMLRMGFVDDVDWILEQTPATTARSPCSRPRCRRRSAASRRSTCAIRLEVTIASQHHHRRRTSASATGSCAASHKLDVLARILEAEPFDGVLIFVRTSSRRSSSPNGSRRAASRSRR